MKMIFSRNNAVFALLLFFLTMFPSDLFADTDYNVLKNKAERFFQYEEWHSAMAMYQLMLLQKPAETEVYAQAITVAGILDDQAKQMELVEKSQQNSVPLQVLFPSIRKISFSVAHADVYENFMLLMREKQPWLKRNINLNLLKYYLMRNNWPKIIATADLLLADTPNDPTVLRAKAKGYFVSGDNDKACEYYLKSLDYDAENFDANVFVGLHYYQKWLESGQNLPSEEADTAARFFSKAYSVNPTPQVRAYLTELGK